MKRIRLYVRAIFGFSRMETNGFLILMPLMLLVLFSEPIYNSMSDPEPIANLDKTDSLMAWLSSHRQAPNRGYDSVEFHFFDPNEISREEFIRLGIDESTAERIVKYRSKGGRFRKKEDVARIYGMNVEWFQKATPWMTFSRTEKILTQLPRKQREIRLDINTADTLQLQDVYGIGPSLARRIVTFRDRLGGFVNMNQLREVYGLDSVVVERVKRQFRVQPNFSPRLINLHNATMEDLSSHPYISRRQASAIASYRSQHGLDSLTQLLQIKVLDEAWLSKLKPYVVIH